MFFIGYHTEKDNFTQRFTAPKMIGNHRSDVFHRISHWDLFISTDAYIIEISEVDGQHQSAGTWLLTSNLGNFHIGNYPTQNCVNILTCGWSWAHRVGVLHPMKYCVMLKIYEYSFELVHVRPKKKIYIYVFQVSALKKLGIVGRHYHFILSKYFIWKLHFSLHFPTFFSIFDNILLTNAQ